MILYWTLITIFAYLYTGFFLGMEDYYKYKDYKDDFYNLDKESQEFILDMDQIVESGEIKKTILIYIFIWLPLYVFTYYKEFNFFHFTVKTFNFVVYKNKSFSFGMNNMNNFFQDGGKYKNFNNKKFYVFYIPFFGFIFWKEKRS